MSICIIGFFHIQKYLLKYFIHKKPLFIFHFQDYKLKTCTYGKLHGFSNNYYVATSFCI